MEQASIDELKQFEEEVAKAMQDRPKPVIEDEPEPEPEPEPDVDDAGDWKKKYDKLLGKYRELEVVINQSFETIRYMGDTVLKMGFTFDEINGMFTAN
jgi:hypothetical protein